MRHVGLLGVVGETMALLDLGLLWRYHAPRLSSSAPWHCFPSDKFFFPSILRLSRTGSCGERTRTISLSVFPRESHSTRDKLKTPRDRT
jgi:hypothetical protein